LKQIVTALFRGILYADAIKMKSSDVVLCIFGLNLHSSKLETLPLQSRITTTTAACAIYTIQVFQKSFKFRDQGTEAQNAVKILRPKSLSGF
jgi:hypothetical protein